MRRRIQCGRSGRNDQELGTLRSTLGTRDCHEDENGNRGLHLALQPGRKAVVQLRAATQLGTNSAPACRSRGETVLAFPRCELAFGNANTDSSLRLERGAPTHVGA